MKYAIFLLCILFPTAASFLKAKGRTHAVITPTLVQKARQNKFERLKKPNREVAPYLGMAFAFNLVCIAAAMRPIP